MRWSFVASAIQGRGRGPCNQRLQIFESASLVPSSILIFVCTPSFSGGYVGGVTPVPISNTEVKPSRADGTPRETARESRSLPDLFAPAPGNRCGGFFFWPFTPAFRNGSAHLWPVWASRMIDGPGHHVYRRRLEGALSAPITQSSRVQRSG